MENLSIYFESASIQIAALIVGFYSQDFSHYLASSSLSAWLKVIALPFEIPLILRFAMNL